MDERLAGAGPALFQVVRYFARRPASTEEVKLRDVQVLETVDTLARDGAEVTVNDIAHQLGLDHSGASRFVTSAIESGLLARAPSQVDGRRTSVRVTEPGIELLTTAHAWQEEQFRTLTESWPREHAEAFAYGLRRLATQIAQRSASG